MNVVQRLMVCGSEAWFSIVPFGQLVFTPCVRSLIVLESLVDDNLTLRSIKRVARLDTVYAKSARLDCKCFIQKVH